MVERLDYKFGFERLEVWQNSLNFVKEIYEATRNFPNQELYCLISQIRRAVISIPSNIAEGSTKNSLKDQARYTEIAFGSLIEVLNQLIIAKELDYINDKQLNYFRNNIGIISRQLNALTTSQRERYSEKQK